MKKAWKFSKSKRLYRAGQDVITIDVLRNGVRQRAGKRNDYTLTQVSRNVFRIEMLIGE